MLLLKYVARYCVNPNTNRATHATTAYDNRRYYSNERKKREEASNSNHFL